MENILDESEMCKRVLESLAAGNVFTSKDMLEFDGLVDDETMKQIALQSLAHGAQYSPKQIEEIDGLVDEKTMTKMLLSWKGKLTKSDIERLDGLVEYNTLLKLDKQNRTHYFDEDEEPEEEPEEEEILDEDDPSYDYSDYGGKEPGLISKLLLFGAFRSVGARMRDHSSKPQFSIGQRVRVRRTGKEGTVISISDGTPYYYTVSLGMFGETGVFRGHELK